MKRKKKEKIVETEESFIILDDNWFVSSFDVDLKAVFTYFDDFKEVLEETMDDLDTQYIIKCTICKRLYTVFTCDAKPELNSYCFECDKVTKHDIQAH
jgi:hypothetical protein